jgi:PAS domain S-box-containing protein
VPLREAEHERPEADALDDSGYEEHASLHALIVAFATGTCSRHSAQRHQGVKMQPRSTLLQGDQLHRLVVDNIAELVALVDSEGTVLYASPAHEQKLGYPPEDLIGCNLTSLVHPVDVEGVGAAFGRCLLYGRAPLGEFRLRHRDGRYLVLDGALATIAVEESRPLLVTAREVTDRVRAEREFVANAAHELLTPLAAMNAALEVLQAGAKEVPTDRDAFLGDLEREVDRLGRLAHALLVLARVQATGESLQLYPVELRPLMQDVAECLRAGTDVPIAIVCDGHTVLAEHDLLERAISNLVTNAVTHTKAGSILLTVASAREGQVGIEVRDTGCGMPPSAQARAFDRFYRAGPRGNEGFGLGLAIVHEIMRVLDGTVEIESELGIGTAVRLVLPEAVA